MTIISPHSRLVQLTPTELVGEVETSNSLDKTGGAAGGGDGGDGNHRLMVGDWIAEWDFTYGAWFYYNTKTEKSTWEQPPEMNHIKFKDPKTAEGNTILFREGGKSHVDIYINLI